MWAFVICFYDAEKDAITLGKKHKVKSFSFYVGLVLNIPLESKFLYILLIFLIEAHLI